MRVRAATPGDVPAILPMVRAICALHESWDPARYAMLPDVVARYERWLPQRARDPRSVLLVAEPIDGDDGDDGAELRDGAPATAATLAGFLVGTVEDAIPIYATREFGFIHDVWVEPAARGRGLARALVREAVGRFARMGVTQVRLATARANDAARALFASCGFRVSSVEMLAELPTPGAE